MATYHRPRRAMPLFRMVILGGAVLLLGGADAPTGGERGVRAFVLGNLYTAGAGEADTCPASYGGLEMFFKMLPANERAKYASADNPNVIEQGKRVALEKAMDEHFGFRRVWLGGQYNPKAVLPPGVDPDVRLTEEQAIEVGRLNGFPAGRGRLSYANQAVAYSSCTNPEDFPALAQSYPLYDGPVAAGIDLDGKMSKQDFVGLEGQKGVDNQLWRVVGCTPLFKNMNDGAERKELMFDERPVLIELRGVDDDRNDPDVTVNIYAGVEPVVRASQGRMLQRVTYPIDGRPALSATTKGKIVDSTLTTDPIDITLSYKMQIVDAPREIRAASIRAKLKRDGSIEGAFYGYTTVRSFWNFIEQMTQNGVNVGGISCPGVRRSLDRLADGYYDAKARRYTAISSAHKFFGVPAFVVGASR